jgi:SAM-dependent methyltransferase
VDYDVRRFATTEGRFAQESELRLFAEILETFGARNVLDAPVGTGRVAIPLAGRFNFTGADISPAMLGAAQSRATAEGAPNITWVECSIDRLPFPDNHFDATITARLFHHVPREMANPIVRELARVVKADGVLIFQFRSGLYGVVLKFMRYYVTRRTGNIRHKCIFPDQLSHYFDGFDIVARYGYKFPGAGWLAKMIGFEPVFALERWLSRIPGVRWLGKYMTFAVRHRAGSPTR